MAQTILLVDDERKLRDMLRVYLEQEGYRVIEASNGREALYVARYEKPDLVLLDLMMPEMGGYEFIRAYHKEAHAPVIMLTAKVEETDEVLGLELGADDYITKPFSVRSCWRACARCCGGRREKRGKRASCVWPTSRWIAKPKLCRWPSVMSI